MQNSVFKSPAFLAVLLVTAMACLLSVVPVSGQTALGVYQPNVAVALGETAPKSLNVLGIFLDVKRAALGCCNGAEGNPNTNQLEVGKVETYKDSKRTTGDGSIHRDHQPSKAAIVRRAEELKGEPLTPSEIKRIEDNAQIVTVPADVHRAGPTYGGKNTRILQESDAKDLQAAATRDADAMVDNAKDLSPKNVSTLEDACSKITCITNDQYDDFLRNQLDE